MIIYTFNELAEHARLFKSISNLELLTTYMDEALKTDTDFLKYIQLIYKYRPWMINVLAMGDNNSVYSFNNIMKPVLKNIPDKVKYEYGSQNIEHFLNTINSYWSSNLLSSDEGRMKLIYLATDVLSSDDYEVFKFMAFGKVDLNVNIKLEKLYKDNNLPKDIYKNYMFSYNSHYLYNDPIDLFDNELGIEEIAIIDSPIDMLIFVNNMLFKYDIKKQNKIHIKNDHIIKKLKNLAQTKDPIVMLATDNDIIGIYVNNKFVSCIRGKSYTEIPFTISLLSNSKTYVVIKNNNSNFIISNILCKNNMKNTTYKANSFNIINLPIGAGKLSLIDIITDEGHTNIFALKEYSDFIGKNTKNFKCIEIHNNNYLISK